MISYLVSLVGGGSGILALLARGEFSKITVVIALPVETRGSEYVLLSLLGIVSHLVVKDSGFARLGLRDEVLVEHIKNVLTDILQLFLNLIAVVANCANMLLRSLGLLLLLNRRDYAPRGATSADDVLVGD